MRHARNDYNNLSQLDKKIPQDEPVFLVRAQDKASADTLRFWARRNLELGGDIELSCLAESHALKMERWHIKKSADLKHK
jgi:predicted lipid carrier protein YhbT